MKLFTRLLVCIIMMTYAVTSNAQYDNTRTIKGKKDKLRSEFTLRGSLGIYNSDHRVSWGVRINEKHTIGFMVGMHNTYIDHAPGDIYAINTSAFYRRYFHLDQRKICAFYIDAYAGIGWVYKVTGNRYEVINKEGDKMILIDEEPGDAIPILGLQPGFRVRCYKNLHFFFGPSIATDCIGAHIGIGF